MRRRFILCFVLAEMLPLWSAPSMALDPALDVSQYGHTAWKVRDGFPSPTGAFAQTADGYLWIATTSGLVRFDGVRSTPWRPPEGQSLPDNSVRVLLGARDGTLWIGTSAGLASWDGGKLRTYPQLNGGFVNSLFQDREGTLWVTATVSNTGVLCTARETLIDCFGEDGRFGAYVATPYEDQRGVLWLAAQNGLWRWKPGPPQLYTPPAPITGGVQPLTSTESGAILLVTPAGIQQFAGDKFERLPVPTPSPIGNLFRDHDGAIWIGTAEAGLFHLHNGRIDAFGRSDGLSGGSFLRFFEDHEGNVWTVAPDGVDRFRMLPATTYAAAQGLMSFPSSVLAGKQGGIWIATLTGLYRWNDGNISRYRAGPPPARTPAEERINEVVAENLPDRPGTTSLFEDSHGRLWVGSLMGFGYLQNGHFVSVGNVPSDYIDSIIEDKQGNIWLAHRKAGLLRVSPDLKIEPVTLPSTAKFQGFARLAVDPTDGGLWLTSFQGDVIHLVDGVVRASYPDDGRTLHDIRISAEGTVWAATASGLRRIRNGHIATLSSKNGLPCDAIDSTIEDDNGDTWLYTGCGLLRIARSDLDAWSAAADQGKPAPAIRATVLDNVDGVRSPAPPGPTSTPHLTKAPDGKLWLTTLDGVTVVDPKNLPVNALPPPVHVEQLVADRKAYVLSARVDLPPLVRDITVDYTALSLVAPEKIQFRYRLEGRDRDWQDAGNRRQAFYTDLSPGNYRFRVIASNNSGVWNEEGASLAFTIAPALWQAYWFLALCATAFVVLSWDLYRMRMRHVARVHAAEKRRLEMETELAHANRLATMGQLTASIAHEVNQPLGATITNVQAALRWLKAESPDPAEVQEALDHAVLAGNRAADVIARIRKLAKKAPVQHETVSLNGEIDGILTITHGEAVKHGVSVRTQLARNLPAITADRVELQQVLLNLIVNAIEAMSSVTAGARELTIRSEEDRGGGVVISVIDTGPGLDPEALERIFQPFYTSKESGLGIGLSICRSIIESYGGKLWASANTPRGAVFQFTLPAAVKT